MREIKFLQSFRVACIREMKFPQGSIIDGWQGFEYTSDFRTLILIYRLIIYVSFKRIFQRTFFLE